MTHSLDKLLQPTSIAVIGASNKANSVGMKVFKNLLQEKFKGKLFAVNPKHKIVQRKKCFSSVDVIKQSIDLAVITTPAITIPDILIQCGKKAIKAALILSSGFSETGKNGKELETTILNIAHQYHIRLIGPNCLGVMRPAINMNATFDNNVAASGGLALVSQSGALSAAILDWAADKKLGFSALISLGNSADVDFGDILNFLAVDPKTKSILLYIEGIRHAPSFMTGLRKAARTKPIIVIKSGTKQQGSRAALSHTGAIMGNDDVFDAALKQAGVVRVMTIEALFSAAEVLSSHYYSKVKGNRLIIITNGGGAGVMAADQASELNVLLPSLNEKTITKLDKVLPKQWSHQNPVDIIGDATPLRYHATLDICTREEADAILTILVPVAMSSPLKVAKQIIVDAKKARKLILACWMGEKQVKTSWKLFAKNNIPCFDTPEKAVAAFSYLAKYYHNQQLLLQTPKALLLKPKPHIEEARKIINLALSENRNVLTTIESKQILKAFYIPIAEPLAAENADAALKAAKSLGYPVVMKINSPDISHKKEAHGVVLNITDETGVRENFIAIINNAKQAFPKATILGVTVESMFGDPNDREIMIGVITDKVFGPAISFGAGGSMVEIIKDQALALPALNQFIIERLINRTRMAKALGEFRNMPPVKMDLLINILLRVSEMICTLPQIQEMDINPLLINDKNAIAVDARMVIAPRLNKEDFAHLAIQPHHTA